MKEYKISRGHNLILSGVPSEKIIDVSSPDFIYFHPSSIKNFKTKLLVKEGDNVKVGSPLFYDKNNREALFVSSCSGVIKKIQTYIRKMQYCDF